MTEPITIGVDHGYAAMKTAHCSFPSGLAEYEHEPYTQKNVLCYDGKYYVVGSGRQPLQQDKTVDENYYLLTLAAIAKEIAYRNAPTATSVILAAGLPLTSFGREKKAFRAYLLREGKPVSFLYEGISYEISVQDVKLFRFIPITHLQSIWRLRKSCMKRRCVSWALGNCSQRSVHRRRI